MKNSYYKKEKFTLDSDLFEPGLQDLMKFKIRKVLFIANLYDYFLIEEDGRLVDLLGSAYKKRDLGYVPTIKQASDGKTALEILEKKEFDLVVTRMRLDDMVAFELAQKIKDIQPDIPVVLFAFSTPEMKEIRDRVTDSAVDRAFLWQGDGKIIVGIIKTGANNETHQNDKDRPGHAKEQ